MMNEMIPFTIANTLDQTIKQRVEVSPQQTVRDVVLQHNPTKLDTFDVYDQDGNVVSVIDLKIPNEIAKLENIIPLEPE